MATTTRLLARLALGATLVDAAACGAPPLDDDASAVDASDATDASDASADDRVEASSDVLLDAGADAVDARADVVARDTADAAPPEPDFDTLPWAIVGNGVAYRDSRNPRGNNVYIGYAGANVTLAESQAWATQLFHTWLHDHGVRYVYAVQGPDDIGYSHLEIGNSHLIATLLPTLTPATHFIAIAGHSSGGWVACEFLHQLNDGGLDPAHLTYGRSVYYDMDGVGECLDATIVSHLRHAYFMSAHTNVAPGGTSINYPYMMNAASTFGSGGFHVYDASASGCQPSAGLCLHVSLINTHPNNPGTGLPTDYADYSHGPVNDWFLASTATDLPL